MQLGFISANLVGQASGYDGTEDWGYHDTLTRAEADHSTLPSWVEEVAAIGFDGLSLWTAHCWYHAVTAAEIDGFREGIEQAGLDLYAYAGGFGLPPADGAGDAAADWRRTFSVGERLGVDQLAGGYGDPANRQIVAELVDEFEIAFGFENHPEGSVDEILEAIAGYEDTMGVAFDTGWAGINDFSAPDAIRSLDDRLLEIHLKDVTDVGSHTTCALGDGAVDIESCVRALADIGFDGWVTIEHEPYDYDPMDDIRTSFERTSRWIETYC